MDEFTWYDGTVTFVDEQKGTLDANVCFDKPGVLMYSVAEGMTYIVPMVLILEITIPVAPTQAKVVTS
jgi:hypothetical protein